MDTALDIARQLGDITQKIDLNAIWQRQKAEHIAALQQELEKMRDQHRDLWAEWDAIADRFRHGQYDPRPFPADLTGNSLNRVFEDHPGLKEFDGPAFRHGAEDAQKAFVAGPGSECLRAKEVAEHAKPMHVGEITPEMERSWIEAMTATHRDVLTSGEGIIRVETPEERGEEVTASHIVPKAFRKEVKTDRPSMEDIQRRQAMAQENARKQSPTGPVVPAPDHFRPLDPGTIVEVNAPNPSFDTICNAVLEQRRVEFYSWFTAALSDAAIEAAAEVLRPVTDGELSHVVGVILRQYPLFNSYDIARVAADAILSLRGKA